MSEYFDYSGFGANTPPEMKMRMQQVMNPELEMQQEQLIVMANTEIANNLGPEYEKFENTLINDIYKGGNKDVNIVTFLARSGGSKDGVSNQMRERIRVNKKIKKMERKLGENLQYRTVRLASAAIAAQVYGDIAKTPVVDAYGSQIGEQVSNRVYTAEEYAVISHYMRDALDYGLNGMKEFRYIGIHPSVFTGVVLNGSLYTLGGKDRGEGIIHSLATNKTTKDRLHVLALLRDPRSKEGIIHARTLFQDATADNILERLRESDMNVHIKTTARDVEDEEFSYEERVRLAAILKRMMASPAAVEQNDRDQDTLLNMLGLADEASYYHYLNEHWKIKRNRFQVVSNEWMGSTKNYYLKEILNGEEDLVVQLYPEAKPYLIP